MKKTLLVLGAGASKDFCGIFPTGLELIKEINYHFLTEKKYPDVPRNQGWYLSSMMNSLEKVFGDDLPLFRTIKNQLWRIQLTYEHSALRNKAEIAVSIDNFIATEIANRTLPKKSEEIIKYCIYYLIKGAEEAFAERENEKHQNWIRCLTKKVSNESFSEIQQNLHVVTFNYDRTFEKYFPTYLKEHLPLDSNEIEFLERSISHMYGYIGNLIDVPFSTPNNMDNVVAHYSKSLSLIDNRNEQSLNFKDASTIEAVHFIGFGYDETNLKRLNLPQFSNAKFVGTGLHFSTSQMDSLKSKYGIDVVDKCCSDYVTEMSM
jgi:hypothetical protein